MESETPPMFEPQQLPPQKAFNVPGVILVLGALLLAIHSAMQFVSNEFYWRVLENFAFIPLVWTIPPEQLTIPVSKYWALLSYFFLHGDWMHVLANLTWFAAFGSVVARRFGIMRFLVFLGLATIASAVAHGLFNSQSAAPMIGASGGISACMGAAIRFAFSPRLTSQAENRPALSLIQSLQNRGILTFVVLWFAFNWLFGAGIVQLAGVESPIAWQAHMGGFVFGLLAFKLFDPK